MFFRNKQGRRATKVDTLVGAETQIKGDLHFQGGMHIDGKVIGSIKADPDSGSVLSLSNKGVIEGEVQVPHIILNGKVVGDVYAFEHIELADQAHVEGNLFYSLIEMARGAEVNGNMVHQQVGIKQQHLAEDAAVIKPKIDVSQPISDGEESKL